MQAIPDFKERQVHIKYVIPKRAGSQRELQRSQRDRQAVSEAFARAAEKAEKALNALK
jgi:hypothetical protein